MARRNFSRRCSRAAAASAAGSSVRSSGAGRPTSAIRRRKISRISARLRWIAGTRMWRGQVVAELHDQLGQVGLPGGDALASASASLRPISWVAIDLTLTTSSTPWRAGDLGDDRARLGGVAGPVHRRAARRSAPPRAARGGWSRSRSACVLDRRRRRAAAPPSPSTSATTRGALGADRRGGVGEVAPQLGVGQRRARGLGERPACPTKVPVMPCPAPTVAGCVLGGGQDLGQVHGAHAGPLPRQQRRRCASGTSCRRRPAPRRRSRARAAPCRSPSPPRCRRSSPRTCRRSRSTPRRRGRSTSSSPRTASSSRRGRSPTPSIRSEWQVGW